MLLDSAVNIPVPPATKEITLRNDQPQLVESSKLTVSETIESPTREIISEIEALSNLGLSAKDSLKDFQRKLYGDATPTKIVKCKTGCEQSWRLEQGKKT